jgi:hypothetical protein
MLSITTAFPCSNRRTALVPVKNSALLRLQQQNNALLSKLKSTVLMALMKNSTLVLL